MAYLSEILSDVDLSAALRNLARVCAEHQAELGLSDDDMAEINIVTSTFSDDLQDAFDAKAAAHSAVIEKNKSRERARELASAWSKTFRASTDISDSLLTEMKLAPHVVPGTRTAPKAPSDVILSSNESGDVLLRWNRGGNRQGTQFIIEVRYSPDASWSMLASVTRSSYRAHFEPGRYVAFRIRAQRANQSSAYSLPVSLWSSGQISLAA